MTMLAEKRMTLTQLARRENVNTATTWRWANRGVRGVKLETFNIGGRRFTTEEAFERFVERSTAVASGETPPVRTSRQRESAIARAERECERLGI